jgi:hypothetical protein
MADVTLSRDLAAAQSAFDNGDTAASAQAHARSQKSSGPVEAGHTAGERTAQKAFVFAGYEGLCSVAVLATAASVLELPRIQVTQLLVGGALALCTAAATREYTRYRAVCDHFKRERSREKWELENYQEGW